MDYMLVVLASWRKRVSKWVRSAPFLLAMQAERPAEAGLVNLLRSTAGHLTSREKLGRTVVQVCSEEAEAPFQVVSCVVSTEREM